MTTHLKPLFALLLLCALAGCAAPSPLPSFKSLLQPALQQHGKLAPIPCSEISTLRALGRKMSYVKNRSTGDTLEYLVVGDGAASGDVLVYFPGTGQIVPGWPTQLITNSTYSPNIVKDPAYRKSQDGTVSLCHDYRLVFFDYPGVGHTPSVTYTRDDVANDVDAILQDVTARYGISTSTVDPVGWSLGTGMAMKYAFLSPVSRPSRTIHNVILYSGHGGGSEQAGGSGQAPCVLTLFEASTNSSFAGVAEQIKLDLTELIFPFKGQRPRQNGNNSGCTASLSSTAVTLSVTPVCNDFNGCTGYIDGYLADAKVYPWRHTRGLPEGVYTQERAQSSDWDVAYCATALPHFTSSGCTAYGSIAQSVTNGGICQTNTANWDDPVAVSCDKLKLSGKVTLLDGFEDLLVQWKYDKAVANGLNAAKPGLARYAIYPGSAGHGLLIQYPKWTQEQTYAAMQR